MAETASRTRLLERAEQNLAEAHATHASAKAASLLSCIDVPDAGIRPVSPSRAMIVLAGIAGGLLVGFGVVFLTVPTRRRSCRGSAADAAPAGKVMPADRLGRPLHSANGTIGPARPVFPAGSNLSLKQALHKIASDSRV